MNNSSVRRILQISFDMSRGGAETLIMNIYRNIDRSKVQFDFLLHSKKKSAYEDEITALGGRIYRIPRFLGYNKPTYDKNLERFLLDHPEYTIIHDHLMDSATETFRIAKKLGRTTIAHSHITQNKLSLDNLIRFFFRKDIYKVSDYRMACSNDAGRWLYRGKADFIVLKNGIETEKFSFSLENRRKTRKALNLKETDLVIGTIGRCVEQKNQKRALEIFRDFHKKNGNSKLVLVGEGPLEKDLKTQAKRYEIETDVVFTGSIKNTNEMYSAFDCFLFPSLYEGLGIVLIEAQANGLPCIISSNIPKDVDVINPLIHRIGLKDDNDVWVETIQESWPLEDRTKAPSLIKKAGYDIKDVAEYIENFYMNI